VTTVFFAYRDAPLRRAALAAEPGSGERYALYGLDQLAANGIAVRHNLEQAGPPPAWARRAGQAAKRALETAGGYGGDFGTVLASLREANRADVVFSTVDTVGIPLVLVKRAGLLRTPLVYAAIGLPERLERLRGERMRRLYAGALGSAAAIVAYSEHEADVLRAWLERHGQRTAVEFVPFGVDTDAFQSSEEEPLVDVVSIGADPHRDFALLLRVAASLPQASFHVVTTADQARTLAPVPPNVAAETDLPFAEMRQRLERARVVALPVRENTYSGATTVLLQSMASGKPVVVTRTRAIDSGYGLVDGDNCRLVAPGDADAFQQAVVRILGDELHARALGARARETAVGELTWERYADRIEQILRRSASQA
jgi:glycosyltransferase involved in cell wall biosynthesis